MSTWRILLGDVRETLASLPDASVQCCVTSPPYWGLRDYGTATWDGGDPACDHIEKRQARRDSPGGYHNSRDDRSGQSQPSTQATVMPYRHTCGKCGATRLDSQLGLEPTPDAYVANMVQVFREVRRVLRDDGTLWLNLGDSYSNTPVGTFNGGGFKDASARSGGRDLSGVEQSGRIDKVKASGLKQKDLVGIPWMVAFALRSDGWYLRSDIIWSKPNPMPESVTDRPTKAHEYLFLLTKSARYYYDAEAVAEEAVQVREGKTHDRVRNVGGRIDGFTRGEGGAGFNIGSLTRNRRTVWEVPTQPYAGAHFATYPEKLIEPCILAGTSEKGQCPACGAAWVRVVERAQPPAVQPSGRDRYRERSDFRHRKVGGQYQKWLDANPSQTTGWHPSCACAAGDPIPQLVLDPFTGSGTTGAVAVRHQRSFIGCELNPAYLQLARTRIGDVAPLLASEVA